MALWATFLHSKQNYCQKQHEKPRFSIFSILENNAGRINISDEGEHEEDEVGC